MKRKNTKKIKNVKKTKQNKSIKIIAFSIIVLISIILIAVTINKNKNITYQGQKLEFNTEMNMSNITLEQSLDAVPQQVPVPKGYVGSPIASEREVNGGFVIYELKEGESIEEAKASIEANHKEAKNERNQWVWIPIEDETDMYHIDEGKMYGNEYTFTEEGYTKSTTSTNEPDISLDGDFERDNLIEYMNGVSREEFLAEMQQEFYEMIKSVATYKGFYIGRYETGHLSKNVPVVRRMNTDIANQTWYSMYKKSKRIAGKNTKIVTHMIWGIQWDETLKWLIDTNAEDSNKGKTAYEIAKDSSSWGNYRGVSFQYEDTSGKTSTKSSTDWKKIPTGSTDRNMANNIYDLASNMEDVTMALQGNHDRKMRGGYYFFEGSSQPADHSYPLYPSSRKEHSGLRCTFYII